MSYYEADPWANHQLNEIKCGECEKEYDEQEGEGNICPTCKEKEGENMYNGYANQDEFHKALQEGNKKYAEAYEKAMKENPQGWTHANCDHAYGYCAG